MQVFRNTCPHQLRAEDAVVGLEEERDPVAAKPCDEPLYGGSGHGTSENRLLAAARVRPAVGDRSIEIDGANIRVDIPCRATRAHIHEVTAGASCTDGLHRRWRHSSMVVEDCAVDVKEDDAPLE